MIDDKDKIPWDDYFEFCSRVGTLATRTLGRRDVTFAEKRALVGAPIPILNWATNWEWEGYRDFVREVYEQIAERVEGDDSLREFDDAWARLDAAFDGEDGDGGG